MDRLADVRVRPGLVASVDFIRIGGAGHDYHGLAFQFLTASDRFQNFETAGAGEDSDPTGPHHKIEPAFARWQGILPLPRCPSHE